MTLNEKLNKYISDKGIKKSYISSKTGMTQDRISRIMRGIAKITGDEFLSICIILDVDPNEFIPDESKTA